MGTSAVSDSFDWWRVCRIIIRFRRPDPDNRGFWERWPPSLDHISSSTEPLLVYAVMRDFPDALFDYVPGFGCKRVTGGD